MAKNFGPKNGNWKGGVTLASNGYVLRRAGREHHLADVRGYAYEHRLVAEEKIGRRLKTSEIVHHINGDKQDNRPSNLDVHGSMAEHMVEHRSPKSRLAKPGQPNETIECECGCGSTFPEFDSLRRPRKFISGHNLRRSAR